MTDVSTSNEPTYRLRLYDTSSLSLLNLGLGIWGYGLTIITINRFRFINWFLDIFIHSTSRYLNNEIFCILISKTYKFCHIIAYLISLILLKIWKRCLLQKLNTYKNIERENKHCEVLVSCSDRKFDNFL